MAVKKRLSSMADVAVLAGVSLGTVRETLRSSMEAAGSRFAEVVPPH